MNDTASATGKADETRARILNAALGLFRGRGFDRTTMREIAAEARVSLGSAYYYFDSKEALVMAFYERASDEMLPRIDAALSEVNGLQERLSAILSAKLDYFTPNRAFLGALFRHAADPLDPLSPFSKETRHIRERDQRHFASAFEGATTDMPKDLAPHLPKLLWLYQMGLILFWIYDRSPKQRRTHLLREKSLALLVSALKLARFPLLRPLRRKIVELALAAEGD
jgi:AcrR family transcriptional regulator